MSASVSPRTLVWMTIAVVTGTIVPLQARINAELGQATGDPFAAAVVSFGGGLAVLTIAGAFRASWRRAIPDVVRALRERRLAWWQLLGGTAGAVVVLAQVLTTPLVGVALLTVAIVAGQTLGGMVVDRLGLGPAGVRPITVPRTLGAVLIVVAVVVSMWEHFGAAAAWWLLVLPLIGGAGNAWQQAVNGNVGAQATTYAATLVNFTVGSILLATVFLVRFVTTSAAGPEWSGTPWYLVLGGLVGVVVVALLVVAVAELGVLQMSLFFVVGQLVGSLALDLVAPAAGAEITVFTIVGLGLAFAAAVVASQRWGAVRDG